MARPGHTVQVLDAQGNIVPLPTIEVRRLTSGLPLVQLYSAREGGVTLGNPFVGAADGSATFFVSPGGVFQVKASKVIGGDLFEKTWPYVPIATGSEIDIDQYLSPVDLPGLLHLLHNDEVASSEHVSSTAESAALKSFSLPANDYDKIKIEAVVRSRNEQDANAKSTFTWRFKAADVAVTNGTFTQQIIASSTTGQDGGDRLTSEISVVIDGGQESSTLLSITGQNGASNAAVGSLVHSFRVYGIKDSAVTALVGPRDVYAVSFGISGRPALGEEIDGHVFTDPVLFPAAFEGSVAVSRDAADGEAEWKVLKNGAEIGSFTFGAGEDSALFALASETLFEIGDALDLIAPSPRDPTLSGVKATFRGRRQI